MLYNTILFVHILGAIVMFMGVGITMAAMIAMLYSRSIEQLRGYVSLAKKADGLLPFSVILILIPGLYLVFTNWGWGDAWINASLILLIVMTIMGPVINLRRIHEIDHAANEASELTLEVIDKVKNKVLWTSVSIMTMLGFAIVFLMTVKVGLAGSLMTIVAAVIVGLGCSRIFLTKKNLSLQSHNEVQKQIEK